MRFDNVCIVEGAIDDSPDCGDAPDPGFTRGDANADGAFNISDPVFVLNFLFAGGEEPTCLDTADVDDDGAVNITDGIGGLNNLFGGGAPPRAPFPDCGVDPTPDDLACRPFAPCN